MSYTNHVGSLAEKLQFEFQGQQDEHVYAPLHARIFDHEAFYESHRNHAAVAVSKARENDSRRKIWSDQNLMGLAYRGYMDGKYSEADFRKLLNVYSDHVETILEEERSLIVD